MEPPRHKAGFDIKMWCWRN